MGGSRSIDNLTRGEKYQNREGWKKFSNAAHGLKRKGEGPRFVSDRDLNKRKGEEDDNLKKNAQHQKREIDTKANRRKLYRINVGNQTLRDAGKRYS